MRRNQRDMLSRFASMHYTHASNGDTSYSLVVGKTVAATFTDKPAAMRHLKDFAAGTCVQIKKGHRYTSVEAPQKRNTSKAIRGKITMLKPGEFRL